MQQEAQIRIDRGQSPEDAYRSARRDFGNVTRTKGVTREMWIWSTLDRAVQDIRYAARMFRKSPSFTARILGVFGAIALALACLGIYAVISYSVEQRRREMGIRMALGAAPAGIRGMVREGMALATAGIAAGVWPHSGSLGIFPACSMR